MMYGVVLHAMKSALLGIRVRWQRIGRAGDFHTTPVTVQQTSAPRTAGLSPASAVAAAPASDAPPVTNPIFVAETRRRARRAIWAGLATAGVASVTAAAIFASLLLPGGATTALVRLPVGSVARASSHARAAAAGPVLHVQPARYSTSCRFSKPRFYCAG
jgi:hypothetical protein